MLLVNDYVTVTSSTGFKFNGQVKDIHETSKGITYTVAFYNDIRQEQDMGQFAPEDVVYSSNQLDGHPSL